MTAHELLMLEIERGQQVAGHFPSQEALHRAEMVLCGQMTPDQAFAELDAKFGL
ncbi:hypothetical protein [Aeromicrobium sp. JJY06]|uniref:hypothetical protein n=1 Tax=Aeromicrobium sp. JJY06 TaxID=3373478 RepID=UPI00376EA90A